MVFKNKLWVFLLLSLILLIKGLIWLAVGVLIIGCGMRFYYSSSQYVIWIRKKILISLIFKIVIIFFSAIALRLFILEIYHIPSNSMEDALLVGDNVLICKLIYGPKLPQSPLEIPWINIFFNWNKSAAETKKPLLWEYRRLTGLTEIKRGDVVVFSRPLGIEKEYLIKRCIGLPGETLEIKADQILINNSMLKPLPTVKRSYSIWYNNLTSLKSEFNEINNKIFLYSIDPRSAFVNSFINQKDIEKVKALPSVDSFKINLLPPDTAANAYPYSKTFKWNFDNFGPILIPNKGMRIKMNIHNYILYKAVFDLSEQVNIVKEGERYYKDGREIKEYIFRYNYYFLLGDFRDNSQDSRFWGFIPEKNIEAKALVVLFSQENKSFRWNRILKVL